MTAEARTQRIAFVIVALIGAVLCGCSQPSRDLVPVPVPEASGLESSVRNALAHAREELERVSAGKPKDDALANAYGELAMTYHAQNFVPSAEAAYANARVLAPRDKRWPYLLGHLYNDASRVSEALPAFESALAIDGSDAAILFSLGEVYLQHGDLDKARTMYEKLESMSATRAAALTGLGKVALAKQQYKEAVGYLEEALSLAPGATRLRQPLAMAYRGLGDRAKAEENIRQFTVDGPQPEIADPMVDAMGAKVASARVLLRRGQRYGRAGRFDLAEPVFRAAVAADPGNAEALANLGVSLANLARLDEAQRYLAQSLAMDDRNAFAHLGLGVILDRQGQDQPAIEHYTAALSRDPANVQAMVYLADAKMRAGFSEDALRLYQQALERTPRSTRLQVSIALANVKAGHYGEARKVLEAALETQPGNPEIINTLARVLATAPPPSVRDGPRALALAKALFETTRNPDVGETYAMALAETGRFDQAVALQKQVIIAAERGGGRRGLAFLQRNLALYEQRKATREGWPADDPLFKPRSGAARLAKNP